MRQAVRGLPALVILLVTTGCDNVEWGGTDVRLQPPPPVAGLAVEDSGMVVPPEDGVDLPPLPTGPVLFMGTRSGSRVSIRPIAEISGGDLLPLPSEAENPGWRDFFSRNLLADGSAFTLFSKGVRVGTVRVDTTFVETGFCEPSAVAEGVVEMVSDVAAPTRFLALPEAATAGVPYLTWQSPSDSYEQRVASVDMATQVIASEGALWPESILGIRADLQAVPLDGDVDGAVAATFLSQDQLATGAPGGPGAYSIFVLGEGGPAEYTRTFTWYRPVSAGGKAAVRFWEQVDWDGDGQAEILLQVFGDSTRWTAALDRRNGSWERIFEEPCGAGPAG